MRIGVPKEIKSEERRVGLTPDSVQRSPTAATRCSWNAAPAQARASATRSTQTRGARLIDTADELFEAAELLVKVKEPLAPERARLRSHHHTLFTYLHLAPDPDQAHDLLDSGTTAIAYESVTDRSGRLPLLAPMSQVAGRMAIPGWSPLPGSLRRRPRRAARRRARRARRAGRGDRRRRRRAQRGGDGAGTRSRRDRLDRDAGVLEALAARFGPALRTLYSSPRTLEHAVVGADLVVGAVLLPGARAPRLISAEMVKQMHPGAVIVDVAIDQGCCAETSRPTTHADPTYVVDEVVHYCVANMPGAVPRTSTQALNNATLPYVLKLADRGPVEAIRSDRAQED